MKFDFSKCKTPEDIEKVWKSPKVIKELRAIKHLLVLQSEILGVPKKSLRRKG